MCIPFNTAGPQGAALRKLHRSTGNSQLPKPAAANAIPDSLPLPNPRSRSHHGASLGSELRPHSTTPEHVHRGTVATAVRCQTCGSGLCMRRPQHSQLSAVSPHQLLCHGLHAVGSRSYTSSVHLTLSHCTSSTLQVLLPAATWQAITYSVNNYRTRSWTFVNDSENAMNKVWLF